MFTIAWFHWIFFPKDMNFLYFSHCFVSQCNEHQFHISFTSLSHHFHITSNSIFNDYYMDSTDNICTIFPLLSAKQSLFSLFIGFSFYWVIKSLLHLYLLNNILFNQFINNQILWVPPFPFTGPTKLCYRFAEDLWRLCQKTTNLWHSADETKPFLSTELFT